MWVSNSRYVHSREGRVDLLLTIGGITVFGVAEGTLLATILT